jgi:hypothetical protein
MTNFDIKIVADPSMSEEKFIALAKHPNTKRSLNRMFNDAHVNDKVYLLTVNGIESVLWQMYGNLEPEHKWSWWKPPFDQINFHGDFESLVLINKQTKDEAEKLIEKWETRNLTNKGKELKDLYDNL